MAVTEKSVRAELKELFPTIQNDEHYKLFGRIGCFLGNSMDMVSRKQLLDAFEGLEKDLQKKKLDRKWWPQRWFGSSAPTEWEKDKDSHLLTSTLTSFEKNEGGFNTVSEGSWWQFNKKERARLYLSFVRADRFREQLARGFHWKDPTVSADHGEFTHRLQWYALIAAGVVSKADAKTVMAKCGTYVRDDPPPNTSNIRVVTTDLWEALFDRDTHVPLNKNLLYPSAESDLDFRNPNNLNRYLREANTLPFLKSFLSARHKKRASDFSIGEGYPRRKMFGADKKHQDLTLEQKTTLYGIIFDGSDGAIPENYFKEIAKNVYDDYLSLDEEGRAAKVELVRQAIGDNHPEPYV